MGHHVLLRKCTFTTIHILSCSFTGGHGLRIPWQPWHHVLLRKCFFTTLLINPAFGHGHPRASGHHSASGHRDHSSYLCPRLQNFLMNWHGKRAHGVGAKASAETRTRIRCTACCTPLALGYGKCTQSLCNTGPSDCESVGPIFDASGSCLDYYPPTRRCV